MNYDVFISYSHKDKNVADAIVNHLENNNFRCWYAPRDIQTGQEWANSIINAISQTKLMVLVFTDYSNESIQVKREIDNALSHGLTIIPFKLTEQPPKGAMEYYLSTLHWLDAMDEPLEIAIGKLCQRVSTVLSGKEIDSIAPTPTSNDNKIKLSKSLSILFGIASGLFLATSVILIFSGLVTMEDDLLSALLCLFIGLTAGVPSYVATMTIITKNKPSHKFLTISGIITLVSLIAVIFTARAM